MNTQSEMESPGGGQHGRPLRALLVEDSPRDAELVVRTIQRGGFDVVWKRVDNASDMRTALEAESWDVIVSDYRMPHFDGIAALGILQTTGIDIPFIMVSGTIGEETAVAAMKAGAHDYLMKDSLARLAPAIERELREAGVRRERQHLDQAVHEAAREWRTTFDAIGDPIFLLDAEGLIRRANLAFLDLVGKDREEVIGRRCCEFIHGTAAPIDECPFQRLIRSGRRESMLLTVRDRHFEVTVDPIFNDEGTLVGAAHILTDITDRRRAEQNRELTAQILEILNRANDRRRIISDILHRIKSHLGVSAVGIRLREGDDFPYYVQNGFDKEFVRHESTLTCRPDGVLRRDAEGRPLLECTCGLVLSGRTPTDHPLFTPNGSFWCNDTTPLLDLPAEQDPRHQPRNRCIHEGYQSVALIPLRAGGEIIGLLQLNDRRPGRFTADMIGFFEGLGNSIGIAMTRLMTEAALLTERDRAQQYLDIAGVMLLVLDAVGTITLVNRKSCEVLGYAEQELMGRNWFDLCIPEDFREELRNVTQSLLAQDAAAADHENPVVTRDGRRRLVAWHNVLLHDEGGQTIGILSSGEDVTEVRNMETQLRQSQKLEAIGTLAGGVAHEINNPVMGIMNYADLIGDKAPRDSDFAEFAGEIKRETERIATIVRNLLNFARQEKQSRSPASMSDIVDSVLSLIRTVMRRDQIAVEVDVPADLPKLECRSQQIQQVMMNLLTNARDALNDKYPGYHADKKVSITASVIEKDGAPWIRTTVEDRGTGIPPDIRDRIFDPFFTTKPRDKGTGLGLAISHGIVTDHGGELSVDSEIGQWTRFHVDLPA